MGDMLYLLFGKLSELYYGDRIGGNCVGRLTVTWVKDMMDSIRVEVVGTEDGKIWQRLRRWT